MHSFDIRVFYPEEAGRILLRTEHDWDLDVEPVAEAVEPGCRRFVVRSARPYLYFKPVLVSGGTTHWAQGENAIAFNACSIARVWPHFFGDSHCSECDLKEIRSRSGGRRHEIRVYLPPGYYENPLARYPVLYMQDGQNLFFAEEAFAGRHWEVGENLKVLDSMNAIERLIVVGIYPNDRMRDYTLPGYEEYGRFLVEELKPTIDARYRTDPRPERTAVMGSSLGGVVSFYLAWQWPEVFGNAACLSSTFSFRDDLLERAAREPRRDVRLYLDSGWPADNFEVTRSMRELLESRGAVLGVDLQYFAFPRATHSERAWAMRSHLPFQFFFGKRPAYDATGAVAGRARRREGRGPWIASSSTSSRDSRRS